MQWTTARRSVGSQARSRWVEKRNQSKKDGAEKGRRPGHYITTYTASRLHANRIQYREFKEAFLPFLEKLDWRAILQEGESPVVSKKRKERDTIAAELYHVKNVINDLEPLRTKKKISAITMEKLQEANRERVSLEEQVAPREILITVSVLGLHRIGAWSRR